VIFPKKWEHLRGRRAVVVVSAAAEKFIVPTVAIRIQLRGDC
jgi:hypothetical protein